MSKYSFSNPKLFMMKLYAVQRIELVHFLHFFAAIILLTSRDNSMRGNVRKATRLPEQVVTVTMTKSHQKPRIILNYYYIYKGSSYIQYLFSPHQFLAHLLTQSEGQIRVTSRGHYFSKWVTSRGQFQLSCSVPGQVRLGQVRLSQVRIGQV